MSSYMILAVGYRCKKDSFLALNAPNCVNVWPVSDDGQEVFVGTSHQKEFSDELIDVTNFDKSKVLDGFESYKKTVRQVSHSEEFNSPEDHQKWLEEFESSDVNIVFIVS